MAGDALARQNPNADGNPVDEIIFLSNPVLENYT